MWLTPTEAETVKNKLMYTDCYLRYCTDSHRNIAKLGIALGWGPRDRRFEPGYSDPSII